MIQAKKIAEVLGIASRVRSLFDLSEAVARGLPKAALKVTIKRLRSIAR